MFLTPTFCNIWTICSEVNPTRSRYEGQQKAHEHEGGGGVDVPASEIANGAELNGKQQATGVVG